MDALDRYQAKKTVMKAAWRPPFMSEFKQDFTVMSYDQSLAKTGWIYLSVGEGMVKVHARGTIAPIPHPELEGWEANFDKARQIRVAVSDLEMELIDLQAKQGLHRWPQAVVLEMPNVHGRRTDSSMLAAHEIYCYVNAWWGRPVLVSIQQSRTILGGSSARNDKKEGHRALERYIPESIQRTWNEHQRDAAINALGHLYNLKQQEAADD